MSMSNGTSTPRRRLPAFDTTRATVTDVSSEACLPQRGSSLLPATTNSKYNLINKPTSPTFEDEPPGSPRRASSSSPPPSAPTSSPEPSLPREQTLDSLSRALDSCLTISKDGTLTVSVDHASNILRSNLRIDATIELVGKDRKSATSINYHWLRLDRSLDDLNQQEDLVPLNTIRKELRLQSRPEDAPGSLTALLYKHRNEANLIRSKCQKGFQRVTPFRVAEVDTDTRPYTMFKQMLKRKFTDLVNSWVIPLTDDEERTLQYEDYELNSFANQDIDKSLLDQKVPEELIEPLRTIIRMAFRLNGRSQSPLAGSFTMAVSNTQHTGFTVYIKGYTKVRLRPWVNWIIDSRDMLEPEHSFNSALETSSGVVGFSIDCDYVSHNSKA